MCGATGGEAMTAKRYWVHGQLYDRRTAQLREMAQAAYELASGWGYAGKQEQEANALIEQAQAILKELDDEMPNTSL